MNDIIFFFFYSLAHKTLFLDRVIVFFANTFPYIVFLLAFSFVIFYRKSLKEFFLLSSSVLSAWFISHFLKILLHIPRPFESLSNVHSLFLESDFSFPSGHATFFMTLAFAVFFINKKVGYYFISFAFLIGVARITAGVHFPFDILGGFLIGYVVAYLCNKLFSYIK